MSWNRRSLAEREGSPAKRVVLTLTDDTNKKLEVLARNAGKTRSEMLRDIIRCL